MGGWTIARREKKKKNSYRKLLSGAACMRSLITAEPVWGRGPTQTRGCNRSTEKVFQAQSSYGLNSKA